MGNVITLATLVAACLSCCGCLADDFLPSGRMAVGANYWASHAATEMWRKWDAKVVDEDLRVLSENGIRMLRVFPNWADFQPIHACFLSAGNFDKVYETRMFDSEEPLPDTPCGRAGVDERMVERFEEFCDIAEKCGIRLIVPLLTGQMTFYESAGRYESDGFRIWEKVRPVFRIVEANDKNVFVSEHPFGDGRVGIILVNNSRTGFDGAIKVRDGWTVVETLADDSALAKWSGDKLTLAPCSGVLLIVKNQ